MSIYEAETNRMGESRRTRIVTGFDFDGDQQQKISGEMYL